jgi:hypothetical protein
VEGKLRTVSSARLKKGDFFVCEAGDTIPADGEIVEGLASIDESAITGESAPVIREAGGDKSSVTGGTKVLSDKIKVLVTQQPGESFLDKMIALVEGATRKKTPNEIALTILLAGFTLVFVIVCITLIPMADYTNIDHPGTYISIAAILSLFVCLIPTTIGGLLSAIGIAGMDRALRANVITKSGKAVETAGDIDTLLLDKTGTITIGNRKATKFHPEINIREITQNGRYYENGQWVTTQPLEFHKDLTYPNIGSRDSYLLYHEELESLVKNFQTIKRARFWMTFGQEYLTHLRVIQNIGMASIEPINYNGMEIVPLQFLKAVLPNPQDLGENYEGETSIGCRIRGIKDGKEHTYYVYNNCSHQAAYQETGMQGVSYTTGVPAMIGAMMFLKGLWKRPGVWNVEEFDPDPFMEALNKYGLPWHEVFDGDLEL